jgi:CheY-like chemotaxis protein
MARIRLVVWNPAEAAESAKRLTAQGHEVDHGPLKDFTSLRALRTNPPDAFVIDLDRLPMQGRDVALAFRKSKATRSVPIVMVGGEPEKVARVKAALSDATYTTWSRIGADLPKAIAAPPREPVVPASNLAGYSGTPLPKKLGIAAGTAVRLIGAPHDFERTLGPLPEGASLRGDSRGDVHLTLWFVRAARELSRVERVGARAGKALWICWPRKTSALASDVNESLVRRAGLDAGLVDYKICAVDATWSGLKFARRKK